MLIYECTFPSQSGISTGISNMAIDEAMLEAARRLGSPIFRFYAWSEPTVSLGYFQHHADRNRHPASVNCPVVRRLTGGGAIVHDRELTYCLAVPPGHVLGTDHRLRLYETVHRAAIDVLADRGISAILAGDRPELISDKGAFLCFRRIAAGDVVARSERFGWVKLLGSAQYRDRFGALLQHGSLLLGRSEAAPELPGLGELLGEELDSVVANHVTPEKFFDDIFHTFTRQWNAKLTERLNFRWGPLSGRDWEEMESSIAFFEEKRYTGDWILKK